MHASAPVQRAAVSVRCPTPAGLVTLAGPARHRPSSARRGSVAARAAVATVTDLDVVIEALLAKASSSESTFSTMKRVHAPQVEAELERVKEVARAMGVNRGEAPAQPLWFEDLLSTDTRQISSESVLTLGRMTWNKMEPTGLLIQSGSADAQKATGLPDVHWGPLEGVQNAYTLHAHFRVLQAQPDGPSPTPPDQPDDLLAFTTTLGEYTVDPADPHKVNVVFKGIRIAPAHPKAQLQRWLATFKDHNPGMADNGVVEFLFPAPLPAFINIHAMTPKWLITQGSLGSVHVLKRMSGSQRS